MYAFFRVNHSLTNNEEVIQEFEPRQRGDLIGSLYPGDQGSFYLIRQNCSAFGKKYGTITSGLESLDIDDPAMKIKPGGIVFTYQG